jgi:hypothetical protein
LILANDFTGVIRATTPGGIFDGDTFHCTGIGMMVDGKLASETTFCAATDKEGNKRLARFTNNDGTINREQLAGTGKYEGLALTPTAVKPLGPFPTAKPGTFQGCNQQTGTYKLSSVRVSAQNHRRERNDTIDIGFCHFLRNDVARTS